MIRTVCCLLLALLQLAPASTLETASGLAASAYKDWTYGADPSAQQIDCVQFLSAVIAEAVARPLTPSERNTIHIHHGWSGEAVQTKAKAGEDPRLSGVVHALVDRMQVGTRVSASEARPGDFVQYWKTDASGRWFGHAAILSRVDAGKARLYGSHKSTNGIAESDFLLTLAGEDRLVYLARLKEGIRAQMQTSRDGTLWLPSALGQTEDGQRLHWTLAAPRWGMYDLQAHFLPADAEKNRFTLRVLEQSLEGESDTLPPARLRVYLPKSGTYPIVFEGPRQPPLAALSLTPAPEGREDLKESDGTVILNSRDATVRGQMLRYEPNPKKRCLGFWANPNDRAEWAFVLDRPGVFRVEIDQGCGQGHGGSLAFVAVGDAELAFEVEDTGHFQNFLTRQLGKLTFQEAGAQVLTVGAHGKAKGAVMDVREIRLHRLD